MLSSRKPVYRLSLLLLAFAFAISGNAVAGSAENKDKDKKKSDQAQQQTASTKVDLNTASEKDLDSLPGIGPATIKKIVANRPYSSVDDLKKAGVAQAQIDKIRPLVTVSASESSAGSASKSEKSQGASPSASSSTLPQSDNATAAPPSGSGMVWVNLDSKIYHREGDRWYGKTKHGKYMTEADAEKAGYRAAKTGKGKE